jgi:hypothetical protein
LQARSEKRECDRGDAENAEADAERKQRANFLRVFLRELCAFAVAFFLLLPRRFARSQIIALI